MSNRIAFFSVVYPQAEAYLKDFFESLIGQTFKEFDVIIANDGSKGFAKIVAQYPGITVIELPVSKSPAENRAEGFAFMDKRGYEAVVLGDTDDYYAPNRIACSLDALKTHDIVINDFDLVDQDSNVRYPKYISNRVTNGTRVDLDFLKDKNVCGLANTALRGNLIKECRFNKAVTAVDWFMFSCLLRQGYSAVFTDKTTTYHRIYGNNTLTLNDMTFDAFQKEIDIKIAHYQQMAAIDSSYLDYANACTRLKTQLTSRTQFEQYSKDIKARIPNPLWLEYVQCNGA